MKETCRVVGFLGKKQCHELKTWPKHFEGLQAGWKTFEVRKDDRGFMCGDFLWFREWCPTKLAFKGRHIVKRVSYVMTSAMFPDGLVDGYAVMAIESVAKSVAEDVIRVIGEAR